MRRLLIDLESMVVQLETDAGVTQAPLGSPDGFRIVSDAWLRSGWDTKYVYAFSWLGRPVIQLPEDLIRLQEVIYELRPDLIIETGVAHGGSLVFSASICHALGSGRVLGVDIEIRAHNRAAIEAHPLSSLITLIEGNSIDPTVVQSVRSQVRPGDRVLVLLDSNHARDHVAAELEAYGPLVSVGSYAIVMDGIMEKLVGAPRSQGDWSWNNPRQAVLDFVARHPEFALAEPTWPFNEGIVDSRVTYWPDAFVRRLS